MLSLTLKSAQAGFFDRDVVQRAVSKGERRVLSKFGAFVRQRAKTSIRTNKGISRPGAPPYSHVGLLKRFIFFAYDLERRSVVIGPTLLGKSTHSVPQLLEYGGEVTRKEGRLVRRLRYRARPFMGPAFAEEQRVSLPKMWQDSIR
jgi:hypothetical protein